MGSQASGKKGKTAINAAHNELAPVSAAQGRTAPKEVGMLASNWASLQERVLGLQADLDEIEQRCTASKAAGASEVQRAEARAADWQRELEDKLVKERAQQANLAAKAWEQQQLIDQLLRS